MTPLVVGLLTALAVVVWPSSRHGLPGRPPRKERRRRGAAAPDVTVDEVLDHLALALTGGAPVLGALRHVAMRLPPPSGVELARVAAAVEWGLDEVTAWHAAPPRWEPARRALHLANHAGVAPAELLRAAAADLRRDALGRVEVATARLSVLLVVPLGLAFLPAFVLTTVVPVVLALAGDIVLRA